MTALYSNKAGQIIMVLLASLSVFAQAALAQGDQARTRPLKCHTSALQQQLLDLHNRVRAKGVRCGPESKPVVAELRWDCKLARAAKSHAADMASNNFLSHTGSNNLNIRQRANSARYVWRALAENVAQGFPSAKTVSDGWLNSKEHCNNIMNGDYEHMGAAEVDGYWTVIFGREK